MEGLLAGIVARAGFGGIRHLVRHDPAQRLDTLGIGHLSRISEP